MVYWSRIILIICDILHAEGNIMLWFRRVLYVCEEYCINNYAAEEWILLWDLFRCRREYRKWKKSRMVIMCSEMMTELGKKRRVYRLLFVEYAAAAAAAAGAAAVAEENEQWRRARGASPWGDSNWVFQCSFAWTPVALQCAQGLHRRVVVAALVYIYTYIPIYTEEAKRERKRELTMEQGRRACLHRANTTWLLLPRASAIYTRDSCFTNKRDFSLQKHDADFSLSHWCTCAAATRARKASV